MWRTSVKNKLMSDIPVAKSLTLIEVNRSFTGTMTERNKHSNRANTAFRIQQLYNLCPAFHKYMW